MSDYCYLEITFRKEDQDMLSKILGYDGDEFWDDLIDGDDNQWIKVSRSQANYGWQSGLENASEKGLVFFGYTGEGGDYESQLFVSFGGKLVQCLEARQSPAVRLDDSFNIKEDDLKEAKEYGMLLKLAVKYVEEGPDANGGGKPPA